MRTVRSVPGLRRALARAGHPRVLVPTMGALHAGHLALVRRARVLAGTTGSVVVSLFVNPTQFGPREDLARYPRPFRDDLALCRAEGVDVVFATCASLTQGLNAARATGAYERKLASLAKVPLLIIDDFGLKPLRAPFDEDLHDLISERYERTTTVVTSNLDYEEWDQAFAVNRLLGSATLDRLRHNAYCLELDGESYRAPRLLPASNKNTVAKKESKSTIV